MFLLNDIGKKLSAYLVPGFENIENTILVFSKNCSYYLNLVFSIFFYVFRNKKTRTKHVLCFSCSPCFSEHKTIFKNCRQTDPKFPYSRYFRRYW